MNNSPLTLPACKDYSSAQVLNTLHKAESPAPDSRGFFAPMVFNSRVVGNDKILEKSGKVASRLCAVLKYLAAFSTKAKFNISQRRPIMAAKSTRAPARRKTKPISLAPNVVASIIFINPEIRRQQACKDWGKALRAYVNTLSDDEATLVNKCLIFILADPKKREYLHGPCPVMPFPVKKESATREVQ